MSITKKILKARSQSANSNRMPTPPEQSQNGTVERSGPTEKSNPTLANRAYKQIRDEILRGNFGIGDVLSRRTLAKLLHMSFVPITEALQRLEAEGLVESRPRIGTRVRIPTEDDIRGTYAVCEALEAQTARLCAARITAEEKEQLSKSARHLDQLLQASQAEIDDGFLFSVHTYHTQFHMRVAEIAGHRRLRDLIERERVLVSNWLYSTRGRRTHSASNAHVDLAAAICSGDVLRADEAMRNHIRYGFEQVIKHFSGLGHESGWRSRNSRP